MRTNGISRLLLLLGIYPPLVSQAVNVQQYSRSNSLTFEMVEDARLEGSHVFSNFDYILTLGASYVDDPLVVKNSNNSKQVDSIISNMKNLHFGAGWWIYDGWQLSSTLNYSSFDTNQGKHAEGFNDVEVKSKFRLFHDDKDALSIMPVLTFPSKAGRVEIRDNSGFSYGTTAVLSDEKTGYGFRVIYERVFKYFQFVGNLGYHHNSGAVFIDKAKRTQLDYRNRLITGAGMYWPLFNKMGLNLEYIRNWSAPFLRSDLNPAELHLGFSTALSENVHFFSGVNFGNLLSKSDGNDYRILAGFKIVPKLKPAKGGSGVSKTKEKTLRIVEERPVDCSEEFLFGKSNSLTFLYPMRKSQLNSHQENFLLKAAQTIQKNWNRIRQVRVEGYSSKEAFRNPDEMTNDELAQLRADQFKKSLLQYLGSGEEKIISNSYGAKFSLTQNSEKALVPGDREYYKLDRRVELTVELYGDYSKCASNAL